jgi:AAA+ superfamily predicted ATPase
MNDTQQVERIINSSYNCISIVTLEEQYALDTVRQVATNLKRDMWIWSAAEGVKFSLVDDMPPIADTVSPENGLANLAGAKEGSICVMLDLAEYLVSPKTLRMLRDVIEKFEKNGNVLVLIDSSDKLPDSVKTYAYRLELSLPDAQELFEIVRQTVLNYHNKKPIEIGITRKGIEAIVRNLRGLSRRQAQRLISDTVMTGQRFDNNDINSIIAGKRRMIQKDGLLEYVEAPVDLNEIGGMKNLKKWLELRKESFTAEASNFGLTPPRGVLMLGVQGAGKSLCAKAMATAWQQPLLRLDPGVLYDRYVGESERRLRQALLQTELMSPVILWIDEIEKAFASAASRSEDGGLSQRMFGSLLTWMQEHKYPVFLVATANDIEALPPELLRKGRFDEIFFVNLPEAATRKDIFAIHLQKRKRDPKLFDLDALAQASEGFSGSEIEQAVISALHEAFSTKKEIITESIIAALKTSPPLSVTMAEKVQDLLEWSKGRCVPAD